MSRRSLTLSAAVPAALVTSLALTACGGHARVPADTANRLADRADAVAARLDDGKPCDATEQLAALETAVHDAEAAGKVPHPVASEILDTTSRVAGDITCPPPDSGAATNEGPPPKDEKPGKGDKKDGGKKDDEKKDKGPGKGHGP